MQIIETIVYTYDELSDKAKEKARDCYIQGNDHPFLSDAMDEYATDLLIENKIKADNFKVFYSLSYSQGDGAMVELDATWKAWRVTVQQRGHYYHERSTEITLTSLKTGECAPDKTIKDFEENVYIPICKKLEKYGYDYIEYEDSEESIKEMMVSTESDQYTFTVDGTRF